MSVGSIYKIEFPKWKTLYRSNESFVGRPQKEHKCVRKVVDTKFYITR